MPGFFARMLRPLTTRRSVDAPAHRRVLRRNRAAIYRSSDPREMRRFSGYDRTTFSLRQHLGQRRLHVDSRSLQQQARDVAPRHAQLCTAQPADHRRAPAVLAQDFAGPVARLKRGKLGASGKI